MVLKLMKFVKKSAKQIYLVSGIYYFASVIKLWKSQNKEIYVAKSSDKLKEKKPLNSNKNAFYDIKQFFLIQNTISINVRENNSINLSGLLMK